MATPYEDESISFVAGVNNPGDYWVSIAARRLETCTTSRGRQYELDTVQTGEYHATWDNRDGALTPGNTASPFYPNVLPYRPVRKRMQYPPTQNMLTANQAASGQAPLVAGIDAPVAVGSTVSRVYGTYANPVVTASASAFEGSQVLQTSVPASPTTGTALIFMTGVSVSLGVPHTFSVYVRTPTGSVALQVRATISWYNASGGVISQAFGTAATLPVASNTWTRVTVTATPPSNAAGMWVGVTNSNSPSASCTLQCDGAQLEYAAAATAYTQPGTWYYLFNGFIERWPQKWDANGLFHKTVPVAVDHFGYLSQAILKPPVYADILALGPNFLYTFDQGKGAQYVTDLAQKNLPAPVTNSPYGAGSLTFGNSVQSTTKPTNTNPAGGGFLGGATTVATFANVDSGGGQEAATYVNLMANGGPKAGGSGYFTRFIAFRAPSPPTSAFPHLWSWNSSAFSPPFGGNIAFGFYGTTGQPAFEVGGAALTIGGVSNGCDGDWHLWGAIVNPSAGTVQLAWDGGLTSIYTGYSSALTYQTLGGDAIGAHVVAGSNNVGSAWAGDVAFIAEFPFAVTSVQASQLYTSFRNAYSGESSAARYSRILGYAGYLGTSNVTTTPGTTAMGPASDITQGGGQATIYAPVTGTDAQTALQNVVTTENGNHFAAADGTLTFQSRSSRYGATAPTIVFGENTGSGEISYEDFQLDFDLTRVANDCRVTQFENSTVFEAFAPASSQNNYFTRTLTRTINSTNSLECNDAASYLAYRYGNPDLRMKTLRVHVNANSAKWATLLALECGVKAREMRRDLAATIQWDGFVEKISWSIDYKTNDVFLDLEMSPADLSVFWFLSAWHTTLASSYSPAQLNSNSTFESGLSPWTASGTSSFTQSSTQKHSGSFSAKLVPDGVTANVGPASEQVAITANGAVTATCWVWFTNAVTNQFSASVNWYNASHTYITTTSVFVSASAATWTQVSNTFQAPAGAAYAALVPVLIGTPPAAQVWYVDDATIQSATVVLNPIGASSTLPVGAYISNPVSGTSNTVQVAAYTTTAGTVAAPKIRLGSGTGTYEEIAVTSYTCTGGSAVTNYGGNVVPGQFTGYTTVTLTLASAPVNSYASGSTVSEALSAGTTDPTAHDVDTVLGTTTIIGY